MLTAGQEAGVMQESSPSSKCPTCQSPIPADAPGGLCPACALERAAMVPPTGTGGRHMPPPTIEEIAPHFPELEILELLGTGGMGSVYKVRQPQLDRTVALKILSHELAQEPAFVERFNREARMLARLSHPNIVAIFDFGTAGPFCYLLMEYVDGVNLRQAMRTGGFKPAEALALVQEVCAALQFAHEEGILHRDIKPENVLIDSKGRVKIADFGIAKLMGAGAPSDVTLTLQGSILGSPHYMAPEQIETPGDVDQRADIYSLGVVLYEMLTGELPIGRFDLPSQKVAMDQRIDEIVLRTLAKERQQRYQSAGEVMTEVGAVAQSPPMAPAPMPASASGSDAGGARGSLSSAIITGIGLGVLLATAILTSGSLFSYKVTKVVGGIGLGLSACLGIVGFILGCVALGAIRRSGGQKSGLGLAVFGTVAWLIVLMPLVGSLFLMAPMPGSGGPGIPVFVLPIWALLTMFTAGFVLVRTLRRWAGGVERDDGGRDFPGMGRGIILSVLIALAGPLLLVIVPHFLPDSGRPDRASRMEMEMKESMAEFATFSSDMQIDRVRPEVVVPVQLEAGLRANFILLQRNEKGGTSATTIGQISTDFPEMVTVKVGTLKDDGPTEEDSGELTVTLSSSGQFFEASTGIELSGWDFFADWSKAPTFSRADRRELELANRARNEDGLSELLYLVVETTPLSR